MKTRIISGAVMIVVGLIVLFAVPSLVTAIAIGAMLAVAAYELLYQTGLMRHPRMVIYSAICAFSLSVWTWAGRDHAWGMLIVLGLFVALFAEMMASHIKVSFEKVALCFTAGYMIPYLLCSVLRIMAIPRTGKYLVLLPVLMTAISDSGAYFAGRFFGKHKLAPVLSPKKTIEGVIGGMVSCVVGMLLYGLILWLAFDLKVNFGYAVIYGLAGSLMSVFGDLCFSVIKRQTGIKDYGNLIPGHGGILDRFDSLVAVAPLAEILLLTIPMAVK